MSFSTGYIFYYWNFFKKLSRKEIEGQGWDKLCKNTLHNGHSLADLLISARYGSLKEEILASGFVSAEHWQKNVIFKANEYLYCENVKNIKEIEHDNMHDLKKGAGILLEHLAAVILYCDMTKLCTDFSATFRKKNQFETLGALKRRHSRYGNMAKLLVEAVNDYGISGTKMSMDMETCEMVENEYENGPFFTGLSCVLSLPEFAIVLKAPCSTSKDIEISLNFAKRDGSILSFQNDVGGAALQSFFDTSWISAYSEENERLFIAGGFTLGGGYNSLRLSSVRIIESAKNFQKLCKGLFIFDKMVSGQDMGSGDFKVSRSDVSFLETMVGLKNEFDEKYIRDSFDLFGIKKTQITLSMDHMNDDYKKLCHLLFDNFEQRDEYSTIISNFGKGDFDFDELLSGLLNPVPKKPRDFNIPKDGSISNVPNAKIFKIFPRLKQVTITDQFGEYGFNFLSLLEVIQQGKGSIQYEIRSKKGQYNISERIKKAFKDRKWNIKKETTILNEFGKDVIRVFKE
eukprot:340128_1